jgi:hypothetical protein
VLWHNTSKNRMSHVDHDGGSNPALVLLDPWRLHGPVSHPSCLPFDIKAVTDCC